MLVPVAVLHRIAAFVDRAIVGGRSIADDQIVDVPHAPDELPFGGRQRAGAFFHTLPAGRVVVMPHDSAGGFGDPKASRIVGGGAGDCGIWNAQHVPALIVARSDPCGARRVVDRCDLVGLVGRARLYPIPRPVAIRILIEGLPVASCIQSQLLQLEFPFPGLYFAKIDNSTISSVRSSFAQYFSRHREATISS